MNLLQYKGYTGTAEISMDNTFCHGTLMFINDLVTYESESPKGLEKSFQEAVDDYLKTCEQIGRAAQKPCSGTFNVRINQELHRLAILKATKMDISLNALVSIALSEYVNDEGHIEKISDTINSSVKEFANSFFTDSIRFVEKPKSNIAVHTAAPPSAKIEGIQFKGFQISNSTVEMIQ